MLTANVIGYLGSDAEIKEFSGKQYVSFSVAHSDVSTDAQGARIKQTTWVSVLWYGNGGNVLQYLKKGASVCVQGRLKVGMFTNKDGAQQVSTNISAMLVELCGSRQQEPAQQPAYQSAPQTQQAPPSSGDDLPF